MDINQDKTLTAFCPLGLSNRLRVLLSGLALAEAAGRRFTMLWPITPACAAPFADLFANDWPVQTVDAAALKDLSYVSGWFGELPDLLIDHNPHLVIGHPSWLIRPGQFSAHDRLLDRCRSLLAGLQPAMPFSSDHDRSSSSSRRFSARATRYRQQHPSGVCHDLALSR